MVSSKIDQLARRAGEHFGHEEGLRQENARSCGARANSQLVLFRQLIHAENGDDVLQRLVALQRLLDVAGNPIVLFAHDLRGGGGRACARSNPADPTAG